MLANMLRRHPHSIDALCALPSTYPSSHSTILTGSSDGLLRAVQLLPTKVIGVVADHGDFPIERIAIDRGGEGRWVGSVGHDEMLRLTDLKDVFEDEDADEDTVDPDENEDSSEEEQKEGTDEDEDEDEDKEVGKGAFKRAREDSEGEKQDKEGEDKDGEAPASDEAEAEDSDVGQQRKKKRKKEDIFGGRQKKKGKNEVDADPSFFSELQ